jgi:hypothetical protein
MNQTIQVPLEDLGQGIEELMRQAVENTLALLPAFIEDVVKPKVVSLCPSAQEEASLISKDASGVGSTEWGRFIRSGPNQLPIRDAIMAETPYKSAEGWFFGDAIRINANTLFSWERHSRGKDGRFVSEMIDQPSAPFDFGYAQALENGGSWTVTPRSGRKFLYPDRGVMKQEMTKTLEPWLMWQKTVQDWGVQSELVARIKRSFEHA